MRGKGAWTAGAFCSFALSLDFQVKASLLARSQWAEAGLVDIYAARYEQWRCSLPGMHPGRGPSRNLEAISSP